MYVISVLVLKPFFNNVLLIDLLVAVYCSIGDHYPYSGPSADIQ